MSRRTQVGMWSLIAAVATMLAWLAWRRYATFHNETFDLAFYARMAWGLSAGDFWEPIVNAHVFGLHLSPVVIPLGWLGRLWDTVPVLLVTQAVVVAAAGWPLARMGERHLGPWGAWLGLGAWLLFPNLGHVATYEFHPGTLAVLPLAWMVASIDRGHARGLALSVVGVLLCREDLGLVTGMAGLVAAATEPRLRRPGLAVAALSFVYVGFFLFVLHPAFAPAHGSMQLHFGKWGDSAGEALVAMLTQPAALLSHLVEPQRLAYLPKLLLPLALLPLLRPRWLVMALPVLGMNLVSEWPTTVELDSHYQTPLLPFLVAGALDGASRVAGAIRPEPVVVVALVAGLVGHAVAGGTPAALDFEATDFRADARSRAAARILARIPRDASVQAPYALMPHLAERLRFGPPPPPDRDTDYVVLDGWHRDRYARQEDLLRTSEEPVLRAWLAREDYGLVAVEPPYVLLERGADPRDAAEPHLANAVEGGDDDGGQRIAACLDVTGARLLDGAIELALRARGPCPADLAVRLGTSERPERVDLLFDGWLSPVHLRAGDRLRSVHPLDPAERARIVREGLRVGALRESGARPEHADPVAVDVPLTP